MTESPKAGQRKQSKRKDLTPKSWQKPDEARGAKYPERPAGRNGAGMRERIAQAARNKVTSEVADSWMLSHDPKRNELGLSGS
jgi:hypothetical protein